MSTEFSVPEVAFFGRTYSEYLQMFALDEGALRGRSILDCPCGPAAFVANACASGLNVVGCDPLFQFAPDELLARATANINDVFARLALATDSLTFRDPVKFRKDKFDALDEFIADYRHSRGTRYLHAALPTLPFADGAFDVVLSSNFLFCYSGITNGGLLEDDRFDLPFHLRSITELARVTRGEIRMAPTHAMQMPPRQHPYMDAAMAHLETLGFHAEIRPSPYDDGFAPFAGVLIAHKMVREERD